MFMLVTNCLDMVTGVGYLHSFVNLTNYHILTRNRGSTRDEFLLLLCVTILKDRVRGMPWPKTRPAADYQLGLSDKSRAIKELVVCWALLNLITWVFGQK